ncbi:ABC-2 family transporter protein [Ligilactobacillus apodemi]|nr:ABC-2 family transporter protein [Ligilactobacillus apodemi]MCR1900851.1 ABC-2 family transporter protein [Ligilactobacillus apodemi]
MIKDYSFGRLGVYLFLANFLALSFSVAPAFRLALQIKSGRLSTLLERPISLYGEHFAFFIGTQFFSFLLVLCLIAYFGIVSGISTIMLLLLVIYLSCAIVMFFSLMLLLGMMAFWLVELWPLRSFVTACYLLFGGRYFPLSHLPTKIYQIVQYNPFSLVTDVPARFLTVGLTTSELMQYLLVTLLWLLVFLYLYKIMLKLGLRLYEGVESV